MLRYDIMYTNAPQNLQELQQRCQQITGKTIGQVASELELEPPDTLLQTKGWLGQLLEAYLGATASSKAMPDFPNLGVELKTIPVTDQFKPLESTYVCTVQTNAEITNWRESWVYRKLRTVLWAPVVGAKNTAISARIFATPILWNMDPETEQVLQRDWEELMEMLELGYAKNLSAKYGTFLHIRPKAANSKVLIQYLDMDGNNIKIVPKGFYLRPAFTQLILNRSLINA